MPAARSTASAAPSVRPSESASSRGGDLAEKVRHKLRQDDLLELLGEEPYTMEVREIEQVRVDERW